MRTFRTLWLIWNFERRAAGRAIADTLHFYGDNKARGIVLALSCIAIGSLINYQLNGIESMLEELYIWLIYGLAPLGALTLALLLWNLFAAPARLFYEQKAEIDQPGAVDSALPTDKGFSVARQRRLIETLKEHAGSNVKILFANVKHKSLAETLISIFELAGWEANLTNVPLESHHHQYFEGIEVSAYNKHLLEFLCDSFAKHGLPARPHLQNTQVKRDNPKWPWIQRYIKITIGHY